MKQNWKGPEVFDRCFGVTSNCYSQGEEKTGDWVICPPFFET